MHWRHPDVLFLLIAVTALARGQQSGSMVGTWNGSFQGFPVQMVLNADGTGSFSGDPTRWRVQNNKLILTDSEGSSQAFDFRLQGSQLILSGGDLVSPMTFTRSGGGPAGSQRPAVREPPQQREAGVEQPAAPESPTPPSAETSPRPSKPAGAKRGLTESDVIHLLDGGVPNERVMDLAQERGVAFPVTPAAAARLKAKGASDQLVAALRQQAGAAPGGIPAPTKTTASHTPAASGGGRTYSHDAWGRCSPLKFCDNC
jgi:hypothetical protein